MKDKIAQLKKAFNEGLDLLKEQKVDDAIAKMAEVAPILKEIEDVEEETVEKLAKSQDDITKTTDLLKTATETIQKWADLFVSAEDATALFQQIKDGAELMKTIPDIVAKVETLEKSVTSRQVAGEPVQKTSKEVLKTVKIS